MVDERHLIIAGQNFRTLRNSRTTHRGGRGYAGASEPRACPVLNRPPTKHLLHAALLACALPWAGAAWAQNDARVVAGINAYRAAPASCPGMLPAPAPALAAQAALARVRLGPGTFPEWALEQAGYHTDKAQVIHVGGAPDADAVLDLLRKQYCRSLLDAAFTDVGVARSGNAWTIVLARPTPPLLLPGQDEAGRIILDLVNAARAQARNCGAQYFGAAPPLAWNAQLALAALAHSSDMATHRYFSHTEKNGSVVDDQTADLELQIKEIEGDTELAQDMKDKMVKALKALIPSDNNKKVIEDLIADPVYGPKLKQLDTEEE